MTEVECTLRPMNCEVNKLSMTDASAMFMQGDTGVMVGVFGPIEGKPQKILHDRATIEVVFSSSKRPTSVDDKVKELYIRESCKASIITVLHPGTLVTMGILELQDAGGLLACVINAACMCLINLSVPMKYTIAAVACMIDRDTGTISLDPDESNLQNARASFTFAFDSIKKNLVCSHTTGRFSEEEFLSCVEKCKAASQHVFDFYREIVKKYTSCI